MNPLPVYFLSALIVATSIFFTAAKYEIAPANTATPSVWKLDRLDGNLYFCTLGKETSGNCVRVN